MMNAHQQVRECRPLNIDTIYKYIEETARKHIARINIQLAKRLRIATIKRRKEAGQAAKQAQPQQKYIPLWFEV
jgi:hypothetical protein